METGQPHPEAAGARRSAAQSADEAAGAAAPLATPSGLPAEWRGVFDTPAADFDAFVLLRRDALPRADLALPPGPAPAAGLARAGGSRKRGMAGPASSAWAAGGAQAADAALVALRLPAGGSVRELLAGGAGSLDAPLSGRDALSGALEGAGPAAPPPKRCRAFLRAFPDKVVAARGPAALQAELLVSDRAPRLMPSRLRASAQLASGAVLGPRARLTHRGVPLARSSASTRCRASWPPSPRRTATYCCRAPTSWAGGCWGCAGSPPPSCRARCASTRRTPRCH